MKRYEITWKRSLLPGVIRVLRAEGYRAWEEIEGKRPILITDASPLMISLVAGDGLWARYIGDL